MFPRVPSLLSSEAIDGRRRDFQMNEGKSQNLRMYFVCNALGYRLMHYGQEDGKVV
jgi:hypothetical protein